ncbi:AlkP-core domain protein [Haloquadratum walsbyi DSM 16790]|uniref:AlkP-core domain protein n=1 Tax=Haloquadratum walsbyi (strain DSM 16790 / HBSQ001) TaxID=362976 RepID=Q18EK3_HALWD|nr:AlkP-core domain protein [Haloquadratum walsbyi DSM 16790]
MSMIPSSPFRKFFKNPLSFFRWFKNNAYYLVYLQLRRVNQWWHNVSSKSGSLDVMSENWDVLIIVDACRYDYFDSVHDFDGKLSKKLSPGSMSQEFINESFQGKELHDTVYVTANPFVVEVSNNTFYDIKSFASDSLNSEADTVPPKKMVQATLDAIEEYPNKRIISHFMQPHHPFLSDFGKEISEELRWEGNQYFPEECKPSDIRRAYRQNIDIVCAELKSLIDQVDLEIVVTSDHGELMGERLFPIPIKGWEHPKSLYVEELIEVPWLRIPGENRKIVSESPREDQEVDTDTLHQRLADLGYK